MAKIAMSLNLRRAQIQTGLSLTLARRGNILKERKRRREKRKDQSRERNLQVFPGHGFILLDSVKTSQPPRRGGFYLFVCLFIFTETSMV